MAGNKGTSITDVARNINDVTYLTNPRAAIKELVTGIQKSINICMPAVVLEYDRETHKAEVLPLVKYYYIGDGIKYVTRQPITVTVRQFCHGGFMIDSPLFVGDTGWIVSSDRDGALCKQQDSDQVKPLVKDEDRSDVETSYPQNPNTFIAHAFEHGFFIPDCWAKFASGVAAVADGELGEKDLYIGSTLSESDDFDKEKAVSIVMSPEGRVTVTAGSNGAVRLYVKGPEGEQGNEVVLDKDGIHVISSSSVSVTAGESVSIEAPSISLAENTTIGGKTMEEIVKQYSS